VFPATYERWAELGMPSGSRSISVGKKGTFNAGSLLPGDYLIAAVGLDAAIDVRDLAFFRRLAPIATRVSLAAGEKKTVDVTLGQIR